MAQRRPVRKTPRTAGPARPRAAREAVARPAAAPVRRPAGCGTTVTVRRPALRDDRHRPARYGTTVTGQRPAFTSRTATEPMMRCPACSEAPTTTASALSSSAAFTRPL